MATKPLDAGTKASTEADDGLPDLAELLEPTRDKGASKGAARLSGSSPASQVALSHITTQVDQIRAQDPPVRLDAPGAVHAMRVATRRLRSALSTFEPLFEPAVTRLIGAELKWLAGVLGTARDAEVLRARVSSAAKREKDGARLHTDVLAAVCDDLDSAYRTAHDALLAELEGDRYRALLAALADLVDHPPLRDRGRHPARKVLPRLVARSERRVRAAMRHAHATSDEVERVERLHDVRKAAKRARYAAESVVPVFGKDARRLAAAMEEVQAALGDYLDSLNAQAQLLELAARTSEPGTAFTYGRLHALEGLHAQRSAGHTDAAWDAARKKKLRRWLS